MRKLLLCALAVVCGAEVADAQQGSGFAFRNANQQWPSAFGGAATGPSWGAQGYMPYYPGYNYPYAAYPAYPAYPGYAGYAGYPGYPVNMMPDYNTAAAATATPAAQAPVASTVPSDVSVALPPLPQMPEQPFEDPAGLMPGMPVPQSAYAADGEDHNQDDAFHRPCNDHVWASFDYTMAWFQPQRVATPLVTTGSTIDPHPAALGQPGTVVLFGGNSIDPGLYSGIRGEVGVFLDDNDRFSLECIGLYIFPNHAGFTQTSDGTGNPILARPVFNIVEGRPTAFVDALPGVAAGGVSIDSRSDLVGAEFNASCHAYGDRCWHVEGLFGFRYMRLDENLTVQDQLQPLINNALTFEGAPVNIGSTLTDIDSFKTSNSFYGLQLGGSVRWEGDWFWFSTFAKIALGATDQTADINGSTTVLSPAGNQTAVGGILALPTNIGHFSQTEIGFIPEAGLSVGVNVTKHIQLVAGYSFLFWNSVARPGSQIDPVVNPTRIPSDTSFGMVTGPGRPAFSFNDESFWLQQINVGIQIHY
jgi:hypothetical protein